VRVVGELRLEVRRRTVVAQVTAPLCCDPLNFIPLNLMPLIRIAKTGLICLVQKPPAFAVEG
jgi:hypothetical protein